MRIKQRPNRGAISLIDIPCKCGGTAKLQEWIKPDIFGNFKRYCQIFCENGDYQTRIYSERTARESRESALNEWKVRMANKGNIAK